MLAMLIGATPASVAGQVRKLDLSEEHPATVILALGRSTAISFLSRPEKVVPGSPQAIQINFVGSDLTVTPVSHRPGNLLVYTKSGRYVILFAMGSDTHYDDVVRVGALGRGRPLRLLTDSFTLSSLRVAARSRGGGPVSGVPSEITVQLLTNEREVSGPDLGELLNLPGIAGPSGARTPVRCAGCLVRGAPDQARISCMKPIGKIHCESRAVTLDLERRAP